MIKTRVQTQSPSSPSTRERSSLLRNDLASSRPAAARRLTALEVARQLYRAGGAGVFFRGLGVCSARAFVVNAVQWGAYEAIMKRLSPA